MLRFYALVINSESLNTALGSHEGRNKNTSPRVIASRGGSDLSLHLMLPVSSIFCLSVCRSVCFRSLNLCLLQYCL